MTVLEEIGHLADVPVDIEVELGRKTMTLGAILSLAPGNVVRLARLAGENIDVLAGARLVGSAEIVIIEERFGVRITDFAEDE